MSTSKLQREVGNILDQTFPELTIRENYRPEWLASSNGTILELDFYIEELKIAFEIQGEQHFEFIPFFHKTISDFEKRKLYDSEKKDLCYGAGVKLIEICSSMDAILEIGKIRNVPIPENKKWQEQHAASLERLSAPIWAKMDEAAARSKERGKIKLPKKQKHNQMWFINGMNKSTD